ncbi:MAG: MarC family protein [Proteobacteria bacterium]|nr:MarC family protein [Pseudomonadota bacterium]
MSSTFFNSFAVLFVAIDAAGIGPLFLLLTEGATREQRFKIAIKSSLIAFIVLIIFAYGGKFFFNWIGVSINSLKIAGGIILFIISIEMLLDKRRLRREESANKVLSEKTIEEISIFPLAIPLIAGPLTAVMIVTFFHMIFSAILANYTSKNILNVFSRVIALILASLAIQFIVDGIKSSFGF